MNKIFGIMLLSVVLLAGCCGFFMSPSMTVQAYQQALVNCDMDSLESYMTEDYADESGWALSFWEEICEDDDFVAQITEYEVKNEEINGDTAEVEVYTCIHMEYEFWGEEYDDEECTTSTYTLKQEGGTWKIDGVE